jgi:hypothetical protein
MAVNIKFGSIGNVQNNTNTYQAAVSPFATSGRGGNMSITPVRVLDIILDNLHPRFKEYGEWNSIGTIFYEDATFPTSVIDNTNPVIPDTHAFPIFPNIKQYPLINEITYVIMLPGNDLMDNVNSQVFYYLPPLNIWNSQYHNAVPVTSTISPNQDQDYTQIDSGSYRRVTDSSTEINLGKTFDDNFSIYPLLPYEGDIIYEGRYGNSIRLGSTVGNSVISNEWSNGTSYENGNPITIIRNGQTMNDTNVENNTNSWVPTLEKINQDESSIYLTSNQQIPLFPASTNNFSFSKSTPPVNASQYEGNQIILNSGRLVFNAKHDSILLLASKTIQLSCGETLGVDAKQISLTADKVYLGSSDGIEGSKIQSVVLGENLNFVLEDIAIFLQTLDIAFKTAVDSNGAPIVSLQAIASDAETLSNDLLNIVNGKNLLSKTVKTI